jgi:hypothetical protein
MKLPQITNKQQEILYLLYRYRFLNRIQIQILMGHKDKKTINMWLRDLKEKKYVEWIYSTHFTEKTKPGIYYIGLNGVRFLKTVEDTEGNSWYPLEEVRKRYREASRSRTFIDRCVVIADCCIHIQAKSTASKGKINYSFVTEADYLDPDSQYHFLVDSELVRPNLVFVKQETEAGEDISTSYLLEIFDATLPRYRVKKRLSNYIEYLDDGEWQRETGSDAAPIALLVCARLTDLIYAKRRTRGLLKDMWDTDDEDKPHIRFATIDSLQEHGFTGGIWEQA